jgi:hypothetical protein
MVCPNEKLLQNGAFPFLFKTNKIKLFGSHGNQTTGKEEMK